eukprot:TRINITY_DN16567_c0_g1_i1.p1 TRINITY_DN16567_c0_g1~~TRINITY_DN16567_c0_g1_i1.p1  ORF type:complete len:222 (+),score=43.39 TRINITY_DN16567_c0_g1_i1:70-735(+)
MSSPSGAKQLFDVLQKRKENPKQKKIAGGKYLPFYGVTCVLHLRKDCLEAWGKPLYQRIISDPRITKVMAPLPAESYHMTLRGLESAINENSEKELFEKLKSAQSSLDRLMKDKNLFVYPQVASRFGSFNLSSPSNKQEAVLREGEELLLGLLPESQSERRQKWHLTLGYEIGKPSKENLKVATEALQSHLTVVGLPQLNLDKPDICSYDSMAHFKPLFSS